jgi:hypothetical protein
MKIEIYSNGQIKRIGCSWPFIVMVAVIIIIIIIA